MLNQYKFSWFKTHTDTMEVMKQYAQFELYDMFHKTFAIISLYFWDSYPRPAWFKSRSLKIMNFGNSHGGVAVTHHRANLDLG